MRRVCPELPCTAVCTGDSMVPLFLPPSLSLSHRDGPAPDAQDHFLPPENVEGLAC